MQKGEAFLAIEDVIARRLTRHRRVAPNPQYVVLYLKGKTKRLSKLKHICLLAGGCTRDARTNGNAGADEHGCLALDHVHIFIDTDHWTIFKAYVQVLPLC